MGRLLPAGIRHAAAPARGVPRRSHRRLHGDRRRGDAARHRGARSSAARPRSSSSGFDRPNITPDGRAQGQCRSKQLLDFLKDRAGESGIVYALSRKSTRGTGRASCVGQGLSRRRLSRRAGGRDAGRGAEPVHDREAASSSAPPSPSAWASTSRTCASSSMPTCRPRSRPITRRSAAPGATASRRDAHMVYRPAGTSACAAASSTRKMAATNAGAASTSGSTRWSPIARRRSAGARACSPISAKSLGLAAIAMSA